MNLSPADREQFTSLLQQMETAIGASSLAQFVQDHKLSWDHLRPEHNRLASFLGMLDSNQPGERANAGRLAAKYLKSHNLTSDHLIGVAAVEPELEPEPPEATWEAEPEPEADWEPDPEPEPETEADIEPGSEWPTYERPIKLDESAWKPQYDAPKSDDAAYERAVQEARAARDKATTEPEDTGSWGQVILGIACVAIAVAVGLPIIIYLRGIADSYFKTLPKTLQLIISVVVLTAIVAYWIISYVRKRNAKAALREEQAWRRSYLEPGTFRID